MSKTQPANFTPLFSGNGIKGNKKTITDLKNPNKKVDSVIGATPST